MLHHEPPSSRGSPDAYAVLACVAQRALEVCGWLSATDMVRGLALVGPSPGPRR